METKMSISDFLSHFGLKRELEVMESTKKYEGSDIPVLYIQLDKDVEGKNYIVLSKNLADKLIAGKSLAEVGQASKDPDYGWGFIAKATVFKTFTIE